MGACSTRSAAMVGHHTRAPHNAELKRITDCDLHCIVTTGIAPHAVTLYSSRSSRRTATWSGRRRSRHLTRSGRRRGRPRSPWTGELPPTRLLASRCGSPQVLSHWCSPAGELQQEVRRSRAKRVEHSAGTVERRARLESDRETNRLAHRVVRLPVRSSRACRPALQAGPPNRPCAPPRLLRSCDGLVAFLFERMSAQIPPLPLFRRHTIMKNALNNYRLKPVDSDSD